MADFVILRDQITRDNALDLLRDIACPHCQIIGAFDLFNEIANNGVGVQCVGCGRHHPFTREKIMWLRGDGKRRANDIASVMKECGAYCYACGHTKDELAAVGVGMAAHHTRPFADHGEQYRKIPLCAVCHEFINAAQRTMRRLVALRAKERDV